MYQAEEGQHKKDTDIWDAVVLNLKKKKAKKEIGRQKVQYTGSVMTRSKRGGHTPDYGGLDKYVKETDSYLS